MDQVQDTSPVFRPIPKIRGLTFTKCLDHLLDGRKLRRNEWPDDGTYIVMKDEKIMVFRPDDKQLHPLTVSTGDITGKDWVVFTELKTVS